MAHSSWLTACSPWSALATLAALTTSLLVLSYVSSSLLHPAAYGYDDPYSPDAESPSPSAAEALAPRKGPGYPPVLAYYITGGNGDFVRVTRLFKAAYHPRNRYLLHLDAGAGAYERARLASYVRSERAFLEYGNVHVVGRGDALDGPRPSAVAAVLRGAAVLLRVAADWDWLVTLGAADYPLVTQDGGCFRLSRHVPAWSVSDSMPSCRAADGWWPSICRPAPRILLGAEGPQLHRPQGRFRKPSRGRPRPESPAEHQRRALHFVRAPGEA